MPLFIIIHTMHCFIMLHFPPSLIHHKNILPIITSRGRFIAIMLFLTLEHRSDEDDELPGYLGGIRSLLCTVSNALLSGENKAISSTDSSLFLLLWVVHRKIVRNEAKKHPLKYSVDLPIVLQLTREILRQNYRESHLFQWFTTSRLAPVPKNFSRSIHKTLSPELSHESSSVVCGIADGFFFIYILNRLTCLCHFKASSLGLSDCVAIRLTGRKLISSPAMFAFFMR